MALRLNPGVAQFGRVSDLGSEGRKFKSCHSDFLDRHSKYFLLDKNLTVTQKREGSIPSKDNGLVIK